jgi:hypothetical protein
LIGVAREAGGTVEGTPRLDQQERRWSFTPEQPWTRGPHALRIATTIEDLAGNNVGKTFDVDLFDGVQRRIETPVVSVAFAVR